MEELVKAQHLTGYKGAHMPTIGNVPNSLEQKLALMFPARLQVLAHSGFWETRNKTKCIRSHSSTYTSHTYTSLSPTRSLAIWFWGRHPLVLDYSALTTASRGLNDSGLLCDLWTMRWLYSGSRFDYRPWGDRPPTGSWVDCWYLRTGGDAGILGEEAIRHHTEVRHKLDQQHIARADNGPGKETE